MKWLVLVLGLSACTGTTAQQRKADIEKAEDKFCELRAKEKVLESLPDASTPTETQAK